MLKWEDTALTLQKQMILYVSKLPLDLLFFCLQTFKVRFNSDIINYLWSEELIIDYWLGV